MSAITTPELCRYCGEPLRFEWEYENHDCDEGYCNVCKERGTLEKHHISYYPEKYIWVHRNCHAKIHADNDLYEAYVPDRERPENYGRGDFHERNARRIDELEREIGESDVDELQEARENWSADRGGPF